MTIINLKILFILLGIMNAYILYNGEKKENTFNLIAIVLTLITLASLS